MDESSQILAALPLFLELFQDWIRFAVSAAIALIIRNRFGSLIAVIISGAIFGLLGTQFELLSLYLTRDGWVAFGTLDAITVALSVLASVLWWVAARALQALVRRLVRGRATAAS